MGKLQGIFQFTFRFVMLEHFFGSKTRVKLLQIFFRNPPQAYYVRELCRLVEVHLNAVRRELANLESLGLIKEVERVTPASSEQEVHTERSKYYSVDTSSLLFPEVKALLMKSQMLEERELIELLKEKAGEIKFFLLTGAFTHADDVETDMFIVGEVKPLTTTKLIKEFERVLGHPIRYTIMGEREFNERREIGDRFLFSVLEAKHLIVVDAIGIESGSRNAYRNPSSARI